MIYIGSKCRSISSLTKLTENAVASSEAFQIVLKRTYCPGYQSDTPLYYIKTAKTGNVNTDTNIKCQCTFYGTIQRHCSNTSYPDKGCQNTSTVCVTRPPTGRLMQFSWVFYQCTTDDT